ncbi:hypothetical protein C2S53_004885 [Perilla frutescens var. hirtella]|uniref:Uncharacterized protein n=1 Tax=Perilla frutescens var. hirtella TaxID=608512 RepID=A0AAD4JGT5_PERFH|nr:hypothetical protein C2S53_004885 [Perilla frutescens var. hirtella]
MVLEQQQVKFHYDICASGVIHLFSTLVLSPDLILNTLEKYPAMDFKGIDWAGNIYEKFEAMRLEVEEVMHEDTMTYVENQVQKVGASVKKFYAEVLVDLLPPSCVTPVKVAAPADFPLEPCTQTDITEKPKSTISDIHGELKNKADGGEDICGLTAEDSTLLSVCNDAKHLSTMPPKVLVGNTEFHECSKKSKAAGVSRRSIGIKRISHPPKMSLAMSSLSDDMIVRGIKSNRLVATDDLNVTRSSESIDRHDLRESDASVESCNSGQIPSHESVKEETNDSECTCLAPDKDSPRQKNGAADCNNSSCHGLAPAPIDSFDIEVVEPEDVLEKSKLEESCVLVEGDDELHFVSQETKKHISYKKKIYNVLSLKSRPTRKQDQCVSDYQDSSENKDAGAMSRALTKLPAAHNSCDFGWELL